MSSIPGFYIERVLGPVMLGVCINAFVYGFSVLQFIQYRTRLLRDTLPVQYVCASFVVHRSVVLIHMHN